MLSLCNKTVEVMVRAIMCLVMRLQLRRSRETREVTPAGCSHKGDGPGGRTHQEGAVHPGGCAVAGQEPDDRSYTHTTLLPSFPMIFSWPETQGPYFVTSQMLLYLLRPGLDAISRKLSWSLYFKAPCCIEHWVYPVFALLHYI